VATILGGGGKGESGDAWPMKCVQGEASFAEVEIGFWPEGVEEKAGGEEHSGRGYEDVTFPRRGLSLRSGWVLRTCRKKARKLRK